MKEAEVIEQKTDIVGKVERRTNIDDSQWQCEQEEEEKEHEELSPKRTRKNHAKDKKGTHLEKKLFPLVKTLPCTTLKKNFCVQFVRPPVFHQGGLGQVGVWFGGGPGGSGPGKKWERSR